MKYSCKELKSMARTQLTGHYGIFIGTFLLYFLINMVVTTILTSAAGDSIILISANGQWIKESVPAFLIYTLINLLVNVLLSVFIVGLHKMYLDGSRGYEIRFGDFFYGFRHHPDRIIVAQFIVQLITTICILPIELMVLHMNIWPIEYILICSIIGLTGELVVLFVSILFFPAMYLLADYDDIGAMQALKESIKLMRGKKGKCLYMSLSFFGWILLSVFSCYISYLWIAPYIMMTETNFYRAVMEEI